MSNQAPPPDAKTAAPAPAKKKLEPPEERFWQRYSPHQELPLSGTGSFTLHALAIGVLVLIGLGIIKIGIPDKVPVEVVQLAGGGGSLTGAGDVPGQGNGPRPQQEDVKNDEVPPKDAIPPEDLNKATNIEPPKAPPEKIDFDPNARVVSSGDTKEMIVKLSRDAKAKIGDGETSAKGRGGPGAGGGQGDGKGTGNGSGAGPGDGRILTQREKRMLRWSITFETGYNGREYLNQLAALGATLAIPMDSGDPPQGYYVIHNLKQFRPKLEPGDLNQIPGIRWRDERPDSVASILHALGLRMQVNHIQAIMSPEVEQKLFHIERKYRGLDEDDIFETQFKVKRVGNHYEPYVYSQTPKAR